MRTDERLAECYAALMSPKEEVRCGVARELGSHPRDSLLPLLPLLAVVASDPSFEVRSEALIALHAALAGGHVWASRVESVAFSPDGRMLVAVNFNGLMTWWDTSTWDSTIVECDGGTNSLAFSPDGRTLADGGFWGVNSGRISQWPTDAPYGRLTVTVLDDPVRSVAYSPDGHTMACACLRDVVIIDVGTGKCRRISRAHRSYFRSVAFSADGRNLACGTDDAILLLDAATWSPKQILEGHRGDVLTVAFSPDGRTLASDAGDDLEFLSGDGRRLGPGTSGNLVILWDAATGRPRSYLGGHRKRVTTIAFSPDGSTLAGGDSDGTVILWDTNTGILTRVLTGHRGPVWSVAFSPDGQPLVVSAGQDSLVIVWDAATGQRKETLLSLLGVATGHLRPGPMNLLARSAEIVSVGHCEIAPTKETITADRFFNALVRLIRSRWFLPDVLNMLEVADPREHTQEDTATILWLGLGLAMTLAAAYERAVELEQAVAVHECVARLARALAAPQAEWRAWQAMARIHEKQGNDKAAFEALRQATDVIDRMWFALLNEGKLRQFFQDKAELYDQMVLCCLRLGYDAMSLEFAEKCKTRYLGDLIARRQLPKKKTLARVQRDFWEAVANARDAVKSRMRQLARPSAREVTGVTWGRPAPGASVARPVDLASLEDYLRANTSPDRSNERSENETLLMVRALWRLGARVRGLAGDAARDDWREARRDASQEETRQGILRALMRIHESLWPVATSWSGDAPSLPPNDQEECVKRFQEAANDLARHSTEEVPLWQFSEMWRNWLGRLLARVNGDPTLCLLELRAVLESLNAVLQNAPVYARLGGPSSDDEQPILQIVASSARMDPDEAAEAIATVARRDSRTQWKYVEQLARGRTVSFQDIRQLAGNRDDSAVLQFYVTEKGTVVYLITADEATVKAAAPMPQREGSCGLEVFTVPGFTLGRLQQLLFDERPAWFPSQEHWKKTQDAAEWFKAIDKTLSRVYDELIAPTDIETRLKDLGIRHLLIVPHRALQVIPLHAVFCDDGKGGRRYPFDKYDIVYAPSCTLASISRERRAPESGRNSLLAIENPTSDLPLTEYEVQTVTQYFRQDASVILKGGQAQLPEVIRNLPRTHVHATGHGKYNWAKPLESHL